jgi:hypothetical protein
MGRAGVTELRIRAIEDLMHRLEWRRGRTGPELAKNWGVSLSTLEKLASEASRRVRATVTDPELVQLTVSIALQRVLHDAIRDNDRRSVVEAAKVWAQISGATSAQKVELLGAVTLEDIDVIRASMRANSEP